MYDIYTHINKIQETANSCLQARTPNGHRKSIAGTSLVVQWLRLQASTAGAQVPSLVGVLRPPMLQGVTRKKAKGSRDVSLCNFKIF